MDEVMNSRLSKHLTTQIVKAHLNLDPDQLSSRKIKSQFISVLFPRMHLTRCRREIL